MKISFETKIPNKKPIPKPIPNNSENIKRYININSINKKDTTQNRK